ncbi:MAG: hypothetical protein FWH40_00180 [Coriobacteriia bacterium]|nr:hypothetical protein [Coriobacteriia bacterium]
MLSTRDNFMLLANKQVPEYIPSYNLFWGLGGPAFIGGWRNPDGSGTDYFGVEWAFSEIVGASLPAPGKFILDDITKWRDVIKVPSDADVDWAAMAQPSLDNRNPELPFGGSTAPSVGFFEAIMSFMGFDEGLMACFEEPEEVKALLNYLCDWSVDMAKKYIQYYKPDYGFLGDDIAHERNPFVSLDMFQDIFAPIWRRYYAVWLEAGLPVGNHNCGHFELLLDDLVDMGCSFWDPVQSSNDAPAIKAKFGNNLALCTGGPDSRFWNDDTPEEQVREEVRNYINTLAPGGGFAMMDFSAFLTPPPDAPPPEETPARRRLKIISEEFEAIRYVIYK